MSEWWTYTLSDFLLFSSRTYYRLIELYNVDIWPVQIVALALGVVVVGLMWHPRAGQGRIVAAILAACWIWVAWAFHWRHYATINWAATYFAGAFVVEALLLVFVGVIRNELVFQSASSVARRIGSALVLFALVVQPVIGPLVGRGWMQAEMFGVTPDSTVIATLGILLASGRRMLWKLGVIPVLWSALSGAVTWTMGSPDALVMPLAALLVLVAAGMTKGRPRHGP